MFSTGLAERVLSAMCVNSSDEIPASDYSLVVIHCVRPTVNSERPYHGSSTTLILSAVRVPLAINFAMQLNPSDFHKNKKLSYRKDSIRLRSLPHSKSFKVTDLDDC